MAGGSGFALQAIRIIAENRRLKRRKKVFDYRDAPPIGKVNNKSAKHLSQEERQRFNQRMNLAKRRGILNELKMYAFSLALFMVFYCVWQMIGSTYY